MVHRGSGQVWRLSQFSRTLCESATLSSNFFLYFLIIIIQSSASDQPRRRKGKVQEEGEGAGGRGRCAGWLSGENKSPGGNTLILFR